MEERLHKILCNEVFRMRLSFVATLDQRASNYVAIHLVRGKDLTPAPPLSSPSSGACSFSAGYCPHLVGTIVGNGNWASGDFQGTISSFLSRCSLKGVVLLWGRNTRKCHTNGKEWVGKSHGR